MKEASIYHKQIEIELQENTALKHQPYIYGRLAAQNESVRKDEVRKNEVRKDEVTKDDSVKKREVPKKIVTNAIQSTFIPKVQTKVEYKPAMTNSATRDAGQIDTVKPNVTCAPRCRQPYKNQQKEEEINDTIFDYGSRYDGYEEYKEPEPEPARMTCFDGKENIYTKGFRILEEIREINRIEENKEIERELKERNRILEDVKKEKDAISTCGENKGTSATETDEYVTVKKESFISHNFKLLKKIISPKKKCNVTYRSQDCPNTNDIDNYNTNNDDDNSADLTKSDPVLPKDNTLSNESQLHQPQQLDQLADPYMPYNDKDQYGINFKSENNNCFVTATLNLLCAIPQLRCVLLDEKNICHFKSHAKLKTLLNNLMDPSVKHVRNPGVNELRSLFPRLNTKGQEDAVEFLEALIMKLKEEINPHSQLIEKLFKSRLKNKTVCKECKIVKENMEDNFIVRLNIPSNYDGEPDLRDMIYNFTKKHDVKLQCEQYECPSTAAQRRSSWCQYPQVLLFQICRFSDTGKINKRVNMPLSAEIDGITYKLAADVAHVGTGNTKGHYVCYLRKLTEHNVFEYFNDQRKCSKLMTDRHNEHHIGNSYLYAYVRVDDVVQPIHHLDTNLANNPEIPSLSPVLQEQAANYKSEQVAIFQDSLQKISESNINNIIKIIKKLCPITHNEMKIPTLIEYFKNNEDEQCILLDMVLSYEGNVDNFQQCLEKMSELCLDILLEKLELVYMNDRESKIQVLIQYFKRNQNEQMVLLENVKNMSATIEKYDKFLNIAPMEHQERIREALIDELLTKMVMMGEHHTADPVHCDSTVQSEAELGQPVQCDLDVDDIQAPSVSDCENNALEEAVRQSLLESLQAPSVSDYEDNALQEALRQSFLESLHMSDSKPHRGTKRKSWDTTPGSPSMTRMPVKRHMDAVSSAWTHSCPPPVQPITDDPAEVAVSGEELPDPGYVPMRDRSATVSEGRSR